MAAHAGSLVREEQWSARSDGVGFSGDCVAGLATWQGVPTASISFQFAGFTGAEPFDDDGISVVGFQNNPGMDRVLGATGFVVDVITGEIVESDIFFNPHSRGRRPQPGIRFASTLNPLPCMRSVTFSDWVIRRSARQR